MSGGIIVNRKDGAGKGKFQMSPLDAQRWASYCILWEEYIFDHHRSLEYAKVVARGEQQQHPSRPESFSVQSIVSPSSGSDATSLGSGDSISGLGASETSSTQQVKQQVMASSASNNAAATGQDEEKETVSNDDGGYEKKDTTEDYGVKHQPEHYVNNGYQSSGYRGNYNRNYGSRGRGGKPWISNNSNRGHRGGWGHSGSYRNVRPAVDNFSRQLPLMTHPQPVLGATPVPLGNPVFPPPSETFSPQQPGGYCGCEQCQVALQQYMMMYPYYQPMYAYPYPGFMPYLDPSMAAAMMPVQLGSFPQLGDVGYGLVPNGVPQIQPQPPSGNYHQQQQQDAQQQADQSIIIHPQEYKPLLPGVPSSISGMSSIAHSPAVQHSAMTPDKKSGLTAIRLPEQMLRPNVSNKVEGTNQQQQQNGMTQRAIMTAQMAMSMGDQQANYVGGIPAQQQVGYYQMQGMAPLPNRVHGGDLILASQGQGAMVGGGPTLQQQRPNYMQLTPNVDMSTYPMDLSLMRSGSAPGAFSHYASRFQGQP